ncbi:MAG: undecaprenyl-diphosphate phosphatase [Acidimicrobiia bacterium]
MLTVGGNRLRRVLGGALLAAGLVIIAGWSLAAPVGAATTTPDPQAAGAEMNVWKAVVLGAVEGVTEYLPISSTGHLVVTERLLGIGEDDATKDAADSFAIAIQFGAILAVLVLYRQRIWSMVRGLLGLDPVGRRLLGALLVAFLPAVVIGVTLEKPIKDNLLSVGPIVAAWIVGGLVLLWVAPRLRPDRPGLHLTGIGWRQALIIGIAQVAAMWPGTSRSLVTILAALAVGTTLAAAVEFSFLLGLLTLGAATVYESATNGSVVIDAYGWVSPVVGLVVAFVAAVAAVRWMVTWLQTRSLAIFGWERIVVGAATIALVVGGAL